jgi:cytochrome subunit of sulfide dehydrogenase
VIPSLKRAAETSGVRQILVFSVAAGLLAGVAGRSLAAKDGRGAQLAAMCASCHRLDGRDKGIPPIVGLEKETLVEAMAAFKSGDRSSQMMHAVALSLSDGEVAAVAEYLATQQPGSNRR